MATESSKNVKISRKTTFNADCTIIFLPSSDFSFILRKMKRAKIINLQKLPLLPHTMTFHMLLIAMHFLLRFFFRQNIGELSNNKLKQHLKKIRPLLLFY